MENWVFPSWTVSWSQQSTVFEWMLVFPIAYDHLEDLEDLDLELDYAVEHAESEHIELGSKAGPVRAWFPETFIWSLVPVKWVIVGYGPTRTSCQPQQTENGQEQRQGITSFHAHKEKGSVKNWIRSSAQFLDLEIFHMTLGNLKSQAPIGWEGPPEVWSSSSCARQMRF